MLSLLLLLPAPAAAELLPFDQPATARWSEGSQLVRGRAVLDSSASEWGEEGVRLVVDAHPSDDVLAVLDLDLDLDARHLAVRRTLTPGDALVATYVELAPGGAVVFRGHPEAGEVTVERMLRTSEVAALALTFSLTFSGTAGTRRLLRDGHVVTDPAPADYQVGGRVVVWHDPVVVDEELEVGVGCHGDPVAPADDGGGCGGDPVEPDTGGSDSTGCEGDLGDDGGGGGGGGDGCEGDVGGGSGGGGGGCEGDGGGGGGGGGCEGGGGGGGGGGGCAGDPMLRMARAHGPLGLVLAFLASRKLRPRRRRRG